MALTNASRLADFGTGIGTQGAILQVDNADQMVGIGTTDPTSKLEVKGDFKVSAASTLSGAVKISDSTNSTSTTTGALIVTGGVGIGASLHVDGDVSIGGTLTYEDVTNIDSVGLLTARSGLRVTAGGVVVTAGVSTFTDDVKVNSTLTATEGIHVTAGVSTLAAVTGTTGSFTGNLTISNVEPTLNLTDTNNNSDFAVRNNDGTFGIRDTTNGVERLTVNSDGIVTISDGATINSTLTATEGIHVTAGVSSFVDIIKCNTGYVSDTNLIFNSDNNANNSTNDSIIFKNAGNELVRIKGTGSVGIGTVAPDQTLELWKASGTNLLKVTSEANSTIGIEIEKTGATTQSWRIADGQTANGKLEIYDVTDSRSVMAFDGTGKVGVGTLSPGMQFHINGSATNDILKLTANGSGQMVNMQNHSNVPAIVRFSNYLGNAFWDAQYNTDNSFSLDHSDSEKFRITSAGTVGINESSPDANFKLHVDGRGKFTDDVAMNDGKMIYWGDSDTSFIKGYDAAAGGYLIFGANNERMRLLSSGRLGIGITNPSQSLVVQAGSDNSDVAVLTGGDASRGLKISTAASGNNDAKVIFDAQNADNGCFSFKTHADERLTISSSGIVDVAGIFVASCNNTVDPDDYANHFMTGNIADGSGWGVNGISFGANSGDMMAIGHNGSAAFFGMQDGSSNSMETFLKFVPNAGVELYYNAGFAAKAIETNSLRGFLAGSDTYINTAVTHGEFIVRKDLASPNNAAITQCARMTIMTNEQTAGGNGYGGAIMFGTQDVNTSDQYTTDMCAIGGSADGGDTANDEKSGSFYIWTRNGATLAAHFKVRYDGNLYGTDTTISSLSDERLKENIEDFSFDLNKFKQLKPKRFNWKHPEYHSTTPSSGKHRGFVAQDLETIDVELVDTINIDKESPEFSLVDEGGQGKSTHLGKSDAMYVSVINQLISKIETLEAKVAALESA